MTSATKTRSTTRVRGWRAGSQERVTKRSHGAPSRILEAAAGVGYGGE